ncbi:MAG: PQQ-like beta-propeller repeat protein [Akkermansiaceae bacterium]|nr:PQQ-like beta-propeller repeat protein [Akkermansiaceae bacterium]
MGIGCSSFVIADNRAFTVGNKNNEDTIWCFNASSGDILWKKTHPEKLAPKYYDGGPGATPTLDGDLVYVLSKSGKLSCLMAQDGKEVWSKSFRDDFKGNMPTWGYSASPLVYGDSLICLPCTKGAALIALNKKTGDLLWKSSNTARPGYAAPVFYSQKGSDAALVFHGRSLVAYNLSKKGEVIFEHPWRTSYDVNASNPLIKNNLVYISSGYGMGYAVLDVSGPKLKVVHSDRDLRMIFQNAYTIGSDIVGTLGDKNFEAELFRMDFKTGKVKWKHRIPGTRGSTLQVGETTIVLSETGSLVFGRATEKEFVESGRHQVLSKLCWAPLAIGEGKLFARTNKGQAICLSIK